MFTSSKALLLNLTAIIAVGSLLAGCADEHGFKAKPFPKTIENAKLNANDAKADQAIISNPAAKTPEEKQTVSEFISDFTQVYKERTDKVAEFLKNLSTSEDAGVVIKGMSIAHGKTAADIEVMTMLNMSGSRLRLIATGKLNLDSKDLVQLDLRDVENVQSVNGIEAYAMVCQEQACKGLARILMKVTDKNSKSVYAIFGEHADSERLDSSIRGGFPTFNESEASGVQAKASEQVAPEQQTVAPEAAASEVQKSDAVVAPQAVNGAPAKVKGSKNAVEHLADYQRYLEQSGQAQKAAAQAQPIALDEHQKYLQMIAGARQGQAAATVSKADLASANTSIDLNSRQIAVGESFDQMAKINSAATVQTLDLDKGPAIEKLEVINGATGLPDSNRSFMEALKATVFGDKAASQQ